MRRLNAAGSSKSQLKIVKELDAFPKIDDSYVETSASSGGISLICFLLIGLLVTSEVYWYTKYEVEYSYAVDTDASQDLKINVDMTVAMPCGAIGADVLDQAGKNSIETSGTLDEIDTVYELNYVQENHFKHIKAVANFVRDSYHSMHDEIWDRGYTVDTKSMPERPSGDKTKKNACHLKGTLTSKKLSGNFHVTLGKPIQMFGGGHAHLAMFFDQGKFNFSHRIHHFSFGDDASGRINPLDGDEKNTENSNHIYQYYIKIVPTKVDTRYAKADTFQFSVTEMDRKVDHNSGSHGTPGIFFKYDISPIKVHVAQVAKPWWKFLVRLCGIVGGIFACTGIVNSGAGILLDTICCRLKIGQYKPKDLKHSDLPPHSLLQNNQTNIYNAGGAQTFGTNGITISPST